MANILMIIFFFFPFPFPAISISSCNGPCRTLDDCDGQLTCIASKCWRRRPRRPHSRMRRLCSLSPPTPPPNPSVAQCQPAGSIICRGRSYPTYNCSPRVTYSTAAVFMTNDFSQGGSGGGPLGCDRKYHNNSELIVALSTGWYSDGSMCGNMIEITAETGRSVVVAKVVDECDSMLGCDEEHSGQPLCGNNAINGSDAVWTAIGLDIQLGEANVTWSKMIENV